MVETEAIARPVKLERKGDLWLGRVSAMASPCEVLLALENESHAEALVRLAATEAWRIEQKFSRYREDSIVHRLNNSAGKPVKVDAETAQLIDFSYQCHDLSDGLFDITSGILRKAWFYAGDSKAPTQQQIDLLLPSIGLGKAKWNNSEFLLACEMEIDLGGIGKEYAVDRTLALLQQQTDCAMLVNFGGDMVCNRSPDTNKPWRIGIENPDRLNQAAETLELRSGALATSGNSQRFLITDGKRYGHVLNPVTGWPVPDAPLSVTVAAQSCTEAGMLATFAMLKGQQAEAFLTEQGVKYWVIRAS